MSKRYVSTPYVRGYSRISGPAVAHTTRASDPDRSWPTAQRRPSESLPTAPDGIVWRSVGPLTAGWLKGEHVVTIRTYGRETTVTGAYRKVEVTVGQSTTTYEYITVREAKGHARFILAASTKRDTPKMSPHDPFGPFDPKLHR